MHKTGLYWFTNDLRVADNPLLTEAASEVDQLICVYLYPQLTPFFWLNSLANNNSALIGSGLLIKPYRISTIRWLSKDSAWRFFSSNS
ncbi:deoxyribodipyrimidine photo-lyase [Vibrio sinaloensis]|nr:deoxyribodipyrimidine photo-lyase [Vibrio sinaloensis]